MDSISEHVVVVADNAAVIRVSDFALVAFDVEADPSAIKLFDWLICRWRVTELELVIRHDEEGALERVGVCDGGRRCMDGRLARGVLLLGPEHTALPSVVPRR